MKDMSAPKWTVDYYARFLKYTHKNVAECPQQNTKDVIYATWDVVFLLSRLFNRIAKEDEKDLYSESML